MIIVGHGARFEMDAVIAFAEKLGAPVITTFKAKGQMPETHALAAGVIGRSGTLVASWVVNEADLLVVLGASFSNHTGIYAGHPIIQVDFDAMQLGKFHPVAVSERSPRSNARESGRSGRRSFTTRTSPTTPATAAHWGSGSPTATT